MHTIIDFDEDTHTYMVNGEIAQLSITELLAKHNLAPSYSGANKQILRDSAEYGKTIHKDIELLINSKIYEPQTQSGKNFLHDFLLKCYGGWRNLNAEKKVGIDYKGLVIAGTIDIIGDYIDKETALKVNMVADNKTTSTIHKKAVTWQVNLGDYINAKMCEHDGLYNERANKFYCFHYEKDGTLNIVELPKIPDTEIEKLLDAEKNGELYHEPKLNIIDLELSNKLEQAEKYLFQKEQEYKEAKGQAEKLRENFKQLFEQQGIKSWTSPSGMVSITYIEPTQVTTIDSTKLKKEQPDIYETYKKTTNKKGYVKVTTKITETKGDNENYELQGENNE